jgi:hypothetical protein
MTTFRYRVESTFVESNQEFEEWLDYMVTSLDEFLDDDELK